MHPVTQPESAAAPREWKNRDALEKCRSAHFSSGRAQPVDLVISRPWFAVQFPLSNSRGASFSKRCGSAVTMLTRLIP
ncbi:hypothetical protein F4560_000692 [Saccharothrix ecbatanensis]|uniref:Uncharacterized protein n=1 Tax=Saccharothrix ecbatanensis TaxID=1105145 RepID=A0A7W9LYJ7_9PSEU|nr:hypothetical protein [Saccharothrix ecbatanensis]